MGVEQEGARKRPFSHHFLLLAFLICHAADSGAAAVASGRNWRISIDRIQCEDAGSLLVIGTRVNYLGPKGPVEAPVSELVDGEGRQIRPKGMVWKDGGKQLAQWLPSGGLANVQSEYFGEVRLNFDVRGATGELKFVFGDIKAFPLTRKGAPTSKGVCESLLKPGQVQAPRMSRAARTESLKLRVHRESYPCIASQGTLRTIETDHPPYLPKQLLLFGRGYLPNARQVELPMGKAPAQPYFYAGVDELDAVENAARRLIAADFPEYRAGLATAKSYAFNWGVQKAPSGNGLYSIGIYDVRACSK
jgi:hypothetical protein